jgi:hypothetical protein
VLSGENYAQVASRLPARPVSPNRNVPGLSQVGTDPRSLRESCSELILQPLGHPQVLAGVAGRVAALRLYDRSMDAPAALVIPKRQPHWLMGTVSFVAAISSARPPVPREAHHRIVAAGALSTALTFSTKTASPKHGGCRRHGTNAGLESEAAPRRALRQMRVSSSATRCRAPAYAERRGPLARRRRCA